jgi:hypothetical protein
MAADAGGDVTTAGDDGVTLDRARLLGRVGLDEYLALAEEPAGLVAAE